MTFSRLHDSTPFSFSGHIMVVGQMEAISVSQCGLKGLISPEADCYFLCLLFSLLVAVFWGHHVHGRTSDGTWLGWSKDQRSFFHNLFFFGLRSPKTFLVLDSQSALRQFCFWWSISHFSSNNSFWLKTMKNLWLFNRCVINLSCKSFTPKERLKRSLGIIRYTIEKLNFSGSL